MTNGGINVEIGNPSYNMYEVDHDNHADAGSLLRPNFTLDPHKVGLSNSSLNYPPHQKLMFEKRTCFNTKYCHAHNKKQLLDLTR